MREIPTGWDEVARDPFARLCNIEAEQGLLGALFIDNRAFEHVADIVKAEDFGNGVHGRIFGEIGRLVSDGRPANPITLKQVFDGDETLKKVGGHAYLGRLAAGATSILNCRHYAETIADLAKRREVICASQDTIVDAAIIDPERPADVVIDQAEERLFSITDKERVGGLAKLGDIVSETLSRIEAAYKAGGAVTVDTGLADLDLIISGMGAGDLCVLAARPSMGKSCLAGTVAINAARKGKRVMLFSLEMSKAELSERWIAGLSGIPTDRQRHGKIEAQEWAALTEAQAILSRLPIMVDDQARLSIPQMRQRARRARRRHGLDLVIVDHLQLVRQGGRQESRRLEIGDATSMLKAVGKELGVPVLLLSQLSRAPEQREDKRPQLSDLRESGDIEQDADVVMFLYREEYYLERTEPKRRSGETREAFSERMTGWLEQINSARGIAEIAVAKNRHGRTGVAKAYFDAERQCFANLAR